MPMPTSKSKKEKDYLKKIHLWYGQPGAGKTTTAANFGDDENKILFFATEAGHKFQEVYKWKREDGADPMNWNDWLTCCREFATDDGGFKCIAVDTVDNLWGWCSDYILKRKDIEHESDEGYGKGYSAVSKEFAKPFFWLMQNGYGVIFLSHEKTVEKQIGPRKFSCIDSTLPNTAKKLIHAQCDYIFYFHSDAESNRMIRTRSNENFNGKDRSGILPELLEMDAKILKEALHVD